MRAYTLAMIASLCLTTAPAYAAVVGPSALTFGVPVGSNNPGPTGSGQIPDSSRVFVDDFFLETITFGGTTFAPTNGNLSSAIRLEVLSGRTQINVDWGDSDTNSDGDDTPLAALGQPNSSQESTDPSIQDPALLKIFSSMSLSEVTDGESGSTSFKVLFDRSVIDNDDGVDAIPEIVIFERGRNDAFDLSLITGGSFENPELSAPLTVNSQSFADVGLRINTREIGGAQTLGIGGFDLNDWSLAPGTEVFGFVYDGSGADLSGIFATGSSLQFGPPLAPIPLPPAGLLSLAALGLLAVRRRQT